MADNLDKMDETFKKSAEEFSLLPSADVWKNIEQDIRKRERRRRFIIFFFAGAGLFIATMLLFPDKAEQNKSASQKEHQPVKANSIPRKHSSTQEENTVTQKNIAPNNSGFEQSATELKGQEKRSVENKIPANSVLVEKKKQNTIQEKNNIGNKKQVVFEPVKQEKQNEIAIENLLSNNTDAKILIAEHDQTATTTDVVSPQQATQEKEEADNNTAVALAGTLPAILAPADTAEPTPPAKSFSRWSVAIGVSPALGFSNSKEDNNYQYVAHYRDSTDKNLLTVNVHTNIAYKIKPYLEVYSGFSLVNFKQEITGRQVVYHYSTLASGPTPQPIIVSKAYFNINGDSLQPIKNNYTFLEIPLGIRYHMFTVRKLSARLQPHIAFNALVRSSGYTYDYNTDQYREFNREDLRGFNFSYGCGVAFQYALRPNLFFDLTPGYQVFHSAFHQSYFSQKFQQAEVRFSLRYYLPE